MLVQTIKLGNVEWECEYDLDTKGRLSAFRAFRVDSGDFPGETYYLRDFTESEQAAIVQTLTGI